MTATPDKPRLGASPDVPSPGARLVLPTELLEDGELEDLANVLDAAEGAGLASMAQASFTPYLDSKQQHGQPAPQSCFTPSRPPRCCIPQGPCGDMEDLPNEPLYEAAGLLIDRRSRWRRRGLYVTDFCASEWCQQQAAFELTAKVPKVGLTSYLLASCPLSWGCLFCLQQADDEQHPLHKHI